MQHRYSTVELRRVGRCKLALLLVTAAANVVRGYGGWLLAVHVRLAARAETFARQTTPRSTAVSTSVSFFRRPSPPRSFC